MKTLTTRKYATRLALCALLLGVLLLISPGVGTESASFTWWDAWRARLGMAIPVEELAGRPFVDLNGDGTIDAEEQAGFVERAAVIGFMQRMPRTWLALQVGATLALCGATFQVLFRNVLATPYTLGVASGGSLGALLAIRLGWTLSLGGVSAVSLAAFVGALGVVALVVFLARSSRGLTSNELLLAGVTLGLFCSAMMMLVTAVSDERATFAVIRWMMGSLDPLARLPGVMLLPLVLPAWVVLVGLSSALNQYRLGDELAAARGVRVAAVQGVCVLVCTLAVSAVVAHCGPIGFVGLVVPNAVALLWGSDCRLLLPVSGLAGGAFLIVCDWMSQLCMSLTGWATGRHLGSATLPIGVVTAIVGVPVFIALLRLRLREPRTPTAGS